MTRSSNRSNYGCAFEKVMDVSDISGSLGQPEYDGESICDSSCDKVTGSLKHVVCYPHA